MVIIVQACLQKWYIQFGFERNFTTESLWAPWLFNLFMQLQSFECLRVKRTAVSTDVMPSPVYTQSCFVMGAVRGYCRVHYFYPVLFPTYSTNVLQLCILSIKLTTVVTGVVAVPMLGIPTIHNPFFILTWFFPLCPYIAIAIGPTRRSNWAEPALRFTVNGISICWNFTALPLDRCPDSKWFKIGGCLPKLP